MNLHDLIIAPLQYPFMQRALLTAVVVGVTAGIMGSYMLVKRWSLMGDAISHAVLPGVAIAYLLGWPYFIGSLVTGLLTAVGIGFVERNSKVKSDAAMGILFIAAFALGLAILSRMRSSVDLYHILFGNILAVSATDLWLTLVTGLVVAAAVLVFWKELHLWSFDPVSAQVMGIPVRALHYLLIFLLSITIVASLQAVGIVLVVAMLITPVATAYLLTHRFAHMMVLASGLGALAGIAGLFLSFHLSVASGATMVLVSTLFFLLAFFFSPSQGVVWRTIQRRRAAWGIAQGDALKALYELGADGARVSLADLTSRTGESPGRLRRLMRSLETRRWVAAAGADAVALTPEGRRRALNLIRSHRLWERFLTDKAGLPWDAVHHEAHRLEHWTSPEMADALEEELGHPGHDPHGAPIPTREGELPAVAGTRLDALAVGVAATVVHVADEDDQTLREMQALGLIPGTRVEVLESRPEGALVLRVEGRQQHVSRAVAGHVTVAAEAATGAAAGVSPGAHWPAPPAETRPQDEALSPAAAPAASPAASPAAASSEAAPAAAMRGAEGVGQSVSTVGRAAPASSRPLAWGWVAGILTLGLVAGVLLTGAWPGAGAGIPGTGGAGGTGSGDAAAAGGSAGGTAEPAVAGVPGTHGAPAPGGRPQVVTTLNIIGDLAARVAGGRAEVHSLLQPGMDPHVYEPVPQDSVALAEADIVFMNGLELEGWMEKLVESAGGHGPVVELAGPEMHLLPWSGSEKRWDPHLWMDPQNAILYVAKIRDALTAIHPAGKAVYAANAAALIAELRELDQWAEAELGQIPPEMRKLITTHDAYRYFGHRYGIQVLDSVWGISTEDEPSAQEIAHLVETLRRHKVPPFVETTVNPKIMEQVAQQAGVAIGGTLYGDSLGPPGSGADTYVGMMRHNVREIVQAMEKTRQAGGDD